MKRVLFAGALFFSLLSPAFAWTVAGHKFVASIAFARLTPREQAKVIEILREHPRFQQDFLQELPRELIDEAARNEWLVQQASIWPDIVRAFKGEDEKYNHPSWHYINLPHFMNDTDRDALDGKLKINISLEPPERQVEEMNAIQTIRLARKMLGDPSHHPADRAILLAWLFHLIGDIHQPLHSSAIFSERLFRDGDLGGSRILILPRSNLHFVWDALPGEDADFRTAHEEALKLMDDGTLAKLGEMAAGQLDEEQWLDESRDLAVNFVYSPEVMSHLRNLERAEVTEIEPISLDPEYLQAGAKICKRRIVQAGFRLGAVLKQIVK